MPTLTITLQGHLLVAGGQAADLGVDLTTARRFDGHRMVPYIPATAVRGAVRMQLEALLRGARQTAVDPYPAPAAPGPVDPVARLFGYSGPLRHRDQALEGTLRFGDALPADPAAACAALAVRPGLEIEDDTGSAAGGKLFFREVAELGDRPLVFTAPLWIDEAHAADTAADDADDAANAANPADTANAANPADTAGAAQRRQDIELLRAAVASTDALGAGKAKGGGAISIAWSDDTALPATRLSGDAAAAARARLILTLREPAHFGDGGPRGNHHATRTYIPGSTVRGAVAWALLRARRLTAQSPEFHALFLDAAAPVSFGDALLAAAPETVPGIRPATRRHLRGRPAVVEDTLVLDLARERVNRLLAERGLYLRADDGDRRFEPARTRPDEGLVRRTRTRVSIDRWTGTAADGRLFSIEQVEPWLFDEAAVAAGLPGTPAAPAPPARFVSIVEAPAATAPGALRRLGLLAGLPLLVGAGRNHGLGQVEVEVRFEPEPGEPAATERLLALDAAVAALAARLAGRAGLPAAGRLPPAATLPVALVALSDYVPGVGGVEHPLAEPALAAGELGAGPPLRRYLNPGAAGGFDQTPGHPPLKDLLPAIGAGSVLVYAVERQRLPALETLLPALRRGVGSRVASGCGRFAVFAPLRENER